MDNANRTNALSTWRLTVGVMFCFGLVWAGTVWPDLWTKGDAIGSMRPVFEVSKLLFAALIGMLVTTVHHPARRPHKSTQPVAHAQILFCVAGALVIIVIGDSLARAFGAFGIASIVRFRTPLKDPEDATVLFLLIGLGMSVGRGVLAVAGLGTLFVCALLWILDRAQDEVVTSGPEAAPTVQPSSESRQGP
jgi:hypothetical protein